jgi:glycosyltransferase involved in cell wall biosynthesis
MRIGVDGRELSGQPTGVGRYLQRLLREWGLSAEARAHQFTIYSPDAAIALPPDLNGEVTRVPGSGGTRWEQGALAAAVRRDRPDVFFAPGYGGPLLTAIPLVVVMHDVSFAAHPEWFRPREGWRRRLLARATARRARSVLTVSQFSRGEIVRYLGVPPDRVHVIPHGVDVHGTPSPARDPLVLFVGSIFNRRHVPVLVQAFARLAAKRSGVRLELVGSNRTHPRQDISALAADAGIADRVGIRDYLPDAELTRMYQRASVFAFLSEYEGFGLTPLEALACGAVPVTLDTPVAREVYGEAAIRVASPDVTLVAEALQAALDESSPARRAALSAAPAVLAKYDWRATAARTLAALEEATRS